MNIPFYKYQGTGNDFIIIDNREPVFRSYNEEFVKTLCDRRFGIGADGLMLLESHPEQDFFMKYFNSDGNESTMCGNGGRCMVAFAFDMNIIDTTCRFEAVDGIHHAEIDHFQNVNLKMNDVEGVEQIQNDYLLDTGSPHYVIFSQAVKEMDVFNEGRKIRYNDRFESKGVNVNFVSFEENGCLFVRTYERGVEAETYSCGTGVIASAISASLHKLMQQDYFCIDTKGGRLEVSFSSTAGGFTNIWLKGPATYVFKGTFPVSL